MRMCLRPNYCADLIQLADQHLPSAECRSQLMGALDGDAIAKADRLRQTRQVLIRLIDHRLLVDLLFVPTEKSCSRDSR